MFKSETNKKEKTEQEVKESDGNGGSPIVFSALIIGT